MLWKWQLAPAVPSFSWKAWKGVDAVPVFDAGALAPPPNGPENPLPVVVALFAAPPNGLLCAGEPKAVVFPAPKPPVALVLLPKREPPVLAAPNVVAGFCWPKSPPAVLLVIAAPTSIVCP